MHKLVYIQIENFRDYNQKVAGKRVINLESGKSYYQRH